MSASGSGTSSQPTAYSDVNEVLRRFVAEARRVLGGRLVGVYLHGSLAAGDYDPERSDIDFVVATEGDLPEEVVGELAAMHAELVATGPPRMVELEGSYVPRAALRRHDPARARHPHVESWDAGRLVVEDHDAAGVIHRHALREHGIAVFGPPARTLVDPVSPDELRAASLAILQSWWAPMVERPTLLEHPGYRAYAVLTMCRMLYTFEHLAVVSKPTAARWAKATQGARWAEIIDRALEWPRDAQEGTLDETIGWIRHTLAACGDEGAAASPSASIR